MQKKRLSGNIALITGTAGGQGRAAAKLAPLDLADETQVKSWIDFAVQSPGGFNILSDMRRS